MSRRKTKTTSRPRLFTSVVSLGRGHYQDYEHLLLDEEPSRYVLEHNSYRGEDAEPSPVQFRVYADKAELESRGFTRGISAHDGCPTSLVICRNKACIRKAAAWAVEQTRKLEPPHPTKFADDGAPPAVKVAYYAEVVWAMPARYSQAHRGVWDLQDGTVLIFGNDVPSRDKRSEQEVDLLRRRMAEAQLAEELAYAISQDGGSWAMLVRHPEADIPAEDVVGRLDSMLWQAWFDACQIALL